MPDPTLTPELGHASSRTRLSPEDRRAAVLAATVPLLVEHGIGVTTRQIADAAGVAEGTLFRVFDDKQALLAAAVASALDPGPVVAEIRALDPAGDLAEVLVRVVEAIQHRGGDLRGVMAAAHELWRLVREEDAGRAHPPHDHPDRDRPGSMLHAMWQLRSRGSHAPALITEAIADLLAVHRGELRRDSAVCARILFSIVTSTLQAPFDGNELTPREIVEVFLDGMRTRVPDSSTDTPTDNPTDTPTDAEAPC